MSGLARGILVALIFDALLVLAAITVRGLDLAPPLDDYDPSSGFGYRLSVMGGGVDRLHRGVDLRAPYGATVRAAAPGVVREVWPPPDGHYSGHPAYGGAVYVEHDDGSVTIYGHLSAVLVGEGWRVWTGREIGRVGSTGISTGPHLHFEHLVPPVFVEPAPAPDPVDVWMQMAARAFIAAGQEERIPR